MKKLADILKITRIPVLVASLCCLSPVILVLFGLGTATFAASLADTLYGQYRWIFRILGLILLGISIFIYFRKKGICSLSIAKKRRNEIINTILFALAVGIIGYIFWLYVVLEYIGKWLKIWS